jgi:hypothetical protein
MKPSDRRLARRCNLSTPLYIRAWKSQLPEFRFESCNVSESGAYFQTDVPIRENATLEIRLEMPEEITGRPAAEWGCKGRVTRIQPANLSGTLLGVRIRFDYYEVLRAAIALRERASLREV